MNNEQLVDPEIARQFDRLPPHSIESEMCLLASAMLDADMLRKMRDIVDRECFYQADHQIIWDTLCHQLDAGRATDAVLIREAMLSRGQLEAVGGTSYLAIILNSVPSSAHGEHYARIVREKSDLRRIITTANDLLRAAYGPAGSDDHAEKTAITGAAALARVAGGSQQSEIHVIGQVAAEAVENIYSGKKGLMIKTGFRDFDKATGGLGVGETEVIAGRPSMGKSLLGKQICDQVATGFVDYTETWVEPVPAAIFSLEESRFKIAENLIAFRGSIENQGLRRGQLTPDEWDRLTPTAASFARKPLYIVTDCFSIDRIRARAVRLRAEYGVRLFMFDYLQLIDAPGHSREAQVANASRQLARLAKELESAHIVISQMNRAVEGRSDKMPTMADLRESGQIEQDADGITFVHREDWYHRSQPEYIPTYCADLINAKRRGGSTSTQVKLKTSLKYQRFSDWEESIPFGGGPTDDGASDF